jgi:cytosine/adenosine deaminase-related metal-dependent hydrolase
MDNVEVGSDWCLIHATHTTDDELSAIARSGAVVGLCPITEANLGDGIFPARRFLDRGGRFGVGTDSNVEIDLAGELRMLEYSQRLALRRRNVMAGPDDVSTGFSLWKSAMEGGAAATGAEQGSLAVGRPADIVTFRAGLGDSSYLFDHWLFTRPGRSMIDGVWRNGVQCVSGGRHLARDGIERRFRETVGA